MPLKGLGLLRIRECSDKEWEGIVEEIETLLARNGYDSKEHAFSERSGKYEVIQYIKKLKTTEIPREVELHTNTPKVGIDLSAITMSIEYVDDTSSIPHKIKLKPNSWGWDSKRCENGMATIDSVLKVFAETRLFKCAYYCSCENQDFVTEAEQKEAEEQAFDIALLTDPNFAQTIIALTAELKE